jgi:diguanylate cyclase (GGDEF)-like protein/PAS domain S-box-containing protein
MSPLRAILGDRAPMGLDHLSAYVVVLVVAGVADIAAAFGVWRRRGRVGRVSLCAVLLAAAAWCLAYALELAASGETRVLWGALKFIGTTLLPAAWLIFALEYTGRLNRPRRRLLAALAIEPVLVLALLAYPSTRSLIRSYPPGQLQVTLPTVRLGAVYWVHFVYTDIVVLAGSAILLLTLMRISRLYWRQGIVLGVAIFLPLIANVMSSLDIAPFAQFNAAPLAVSLSAWTLVLGVLRFQLLDLRPVARTLVVETMRDAVVVADAHGQVVDVNPAAQRLLGIPAAALIGCPADTLFPHLETPQADKQMALREPLRGGLDRTGDLELVVTPLIDARGATAGRVLVFRDVSERKELERNLRQLAYTDALTGLPNRTLFHDRLKQGLAAASRRGTPLAVLFLDLDRFKVINDSLGHDVGDRVLMSVARRLATCLREEDTLARLGGDEFAVLMPDISGVRGSSSVADKLLSALSAPHMINGHELTVGASIGIALFPQNGSDVQSLLRSADAAMYSAKARGRGRTALFTPDLGERNTRRQQLEVELRRGLRSGQLQLAFQPYHELASGEMVGYEALVRWQHPRSGLLAPASFLGLAEDAGLIEAIDRWVLGEACRQACRWNSPLTVSVNVSPGRLRAGDLRQHTAQILGQTDLDPGRLTLELSERTLFDDEPEAFGMLSEIATAGVGVALDDFGAGYASLGHLRRLPLTQLKIDRSLVATLGQNGDSPIVAAVTSFAHALGLSVTAEGIEHPAQLERLVDLGCDFGQGFLFGQPEPASALTPS